MLIHDNYVKSEFEMTLTDDEVADLLYAAAQADAAVTLTPLAEGECRWEPEATYRAKVQLEGSVMGAGPRLRALWATLQKVELCFDPFTREMAFWSPPRLPAAD